MIAALAFVQAAVSVSTLPAWVVAALLWSNGFMVAGLFALISRQKGIDTIKLGLEAQITGARTAVEALVRTESAARASEINSFRADRSQIILDFSGRVSALEREVVGTNGLSAQVLRIGKGVESLVSLFLRHGQKMGIDAADIRELEEHR